MVATCSGRWAGTATTAGTPEAEELRAESGALAAIPTVDPEGTIAAGGSARAIGAGVGVGVAAGSSARAIGG
jgi:hypothetical protein